MKDNADYDSPKRKLINLHGIRLSLLVCLHCGLGGQSYIRGWEHKGGGWWVRRLWGWLMNRERADGVSPLQMDGGYYCHGITEQNLVFFYSNEISEDGDESVSLRWRGSGTVVVVGGISATNNWWSRGEGKRRKWSRLLLSIKSYCSHFAMNWQMKR